MSNQHADETRTEFAYKGKQVKISQSAESATITIDGQTFKAGRSAGMWSGAGIHNPYGALSDLARHIVDYFHLFTPSR
jgi:hypothetical protein